MPNEDLKRLMDKEKTADTVDPAKAAAPTDKTNTEGQTAAATPEKWRVKVKIGGEDRELNDDQIASTFERYRDLNYKHATFKPAIDFIEEAARKAGKEPSAVMAELMERLSGKQDQQAQQQQQQPTAEDDDEALSKWEQENGASLPPGFRDMRKGIRGVADGQAQLMAMLKDVMNASKGVADAAKEAQTDAREKTIQSIKRNVGVNLNAAQQKLGLPDEAAKDFMLFASERGFTMEDFIDPQLTLKVATDFKNAMSTPDFERMKEVAARRQAFTGSVGTSPSASSATGGDTPKDAIFDRLAAKAKR